MLVICAWCGNKISDDSNEDGAVSHGICRDCAAAHFSFCPQNLEDVLDKFSTPILIVDSNGNIETVNRSALDFLGKERKDIKHLPGGNVFGCIHSVEPGGCGKTIHCKLCTIRRTVEEVQKTGKNQYKVPATLKVMDKVSENDIICTISVEKVGEFVVLTVEDYKQSNSPCHSIS